MRAKNYDKRIYRFVAILKELDSKKYVTTQGLAEEFNVSRRTIQRDMRILNDAGFPIYSDGEGMHSFIEGFKLNKVSLTKEEASLFAIMYEVSDSLGDKFRESFRSLFYKLIVENFSAPYYVKFPHVSEKCGAFDFDSIEDAIRNSKVIFISYKNTAGGVSEYEVNPIKILFYDGFWYLLGVDRSCGKLKKFRIDSISELSVSNESFYYNSDKISEILSESVNIWFLSGDKSEIVKLKVSGEKANYFKLRKYFPYQKIVREYKNGDILLEVKISCSNEILPTIMKWLPYIKIVSPVSLKRELEKILRKYLEEF